MNTASAITSYLLLFGFVLSWIRVGVMVHDWLLEHEEILPFDIFDSLIVVLGPLNIIVLPLLAAIDRVTNISEPIANYLDRRRIREEAEAAREIDNAEPPFNPAKYRSEQWKE